MLSHKQRPEPESLRPHVIGRIIISPQTRPDKPLPHPLHAVGVNFQSQWRRASGHHVRPRRLSSRREISSKGLHISTMIRRGHPTCTMAGSQGLRATARLPRKSVDPGTREWQSPSGWRWRPGRGRILVSSPWSCSTFFPNGENPPDGRVNHRAGDVARGCKVVNCAISSAEP